MPVSEHAQNLATLRAGAVNPRKLIVAQQLQDQFRIAPVVLLPSPGAPPNLGRVPEPNLVPEFVLQLFEPGRISAGLEAHDSRTGPLGLELTERFLELVLSVMASKLYGFCFEN